VPLGRLENHKPKMLQLIETLTKIISEMYVEKIFGGFWEKLLDGCIKTLRGHTACIK
jgi:hypothetical protein